MNVFYICIHVFLHVYVWVCLFVYRRQSAAHSLWNNTPMFMHSARVRHRKIYKQNIEFTNLLGSLYVFWLKQTTACTFAVIICLYLLFLCIVPFLFGLLLMGSRQ